MEHSVVGIPFLKLPGIRNVWTARISQVAGWERIGESIGAIFHIDIVQTRHPHASGSDLCNHLLKEIAEHATLLQFLEALRVLSLDTPFNLAEEFENHIKEYSAYLPLCDPPPSDACWFLLFTPELDANPFVHNILASGYDKSETIENDHFTARRLSNRNPISRISFIIVELTTANSAVQFVNTVGQIPNLVIVHKQVSYSQRTQICLLDNFPTQNDALATIADKHHLCPSIVRQISTDQLEDAGIKQLCNTLEEATNYQAIIILDDEASETHLMCLLGSLILADKSIFPPSGTLLLHLSFNNTKEILERTNIFDQTFPAKHCRIFDVGNGSEVIASVSSFQACHELFYKGDLTAKFKKHFLTLTDVKLFQPTHLIELHANVTQPEDRERIRFISAMFNVQIPPMDLPALVGIVPVEGNVPLNVLNHAANDLPPHIPIAEEEEPNPPFIFVARNSRDLQNAQRDQLLQCILARAIILEEGQILHRGFDYWIVVKSYLPIGLETSSGERKSLRNEENIDGHWIIKVYLPRDGLFHVVQGDRPNPTRLSSFSVGIPPPNPNNIVVLVPNQLTEQAVGLYLINHGFEQREGDHDLQRLFYRRGNKRVVLVKEEDRVVLTDLVLTFAGRVVWLTQNIAQVNGLVERQISLRLTLGDHLAIQVTEDEEYLNNLLDSQLLVVDHLVII